MSFVNFEKKEINFKIVYYGPALSGKTTNLEYLHAAMPKDVRGEITVLSTAQDRTLFFDFLPLESRAIKGFVSRFQLYTVPGQTIYNRTRRLVLAGVDGIVFVADSQWQCMENNAVSFANLGDNLKTYTRTLEQIPYILQFNKRDLGSIAPVAYLDFLLNQGTVRAPSFETVANQGVAVGESLNMISKMVMAHFIEEHKMSVDDFVGRKEGVLKESRPGT
jgi:mutual gliding-motility protein MglA